VIGSRAIIGGVLACSLAAWPAEGGRDRAEPGLIEAGTSIGSLSGADVALLVGVASVSERRTVRAEAERSLKLLERSEAALRERARVIESLMTTRPADSATLRAELERVRSDELGARLPLVRGRAGVLLAALGAASSGDASRRELLMRAIDDLRASEPATTAGEALRRVTLAHALVLLREAAARAEAVELLDSVLELPAGDQPERSVPVALALEAASARWLLSDGAGEPPGRGLAWRVQLQARRGLDGLASGASAEQLDAALEPLASVAPEGGVMGSEAAARIAGALSVWPEAQWPARGRYAAGRAALELGERAEGLAWLDRAAGADQPQPWRSEAAWLAARERVERGGEELSAGIDGLVGLIGGANAESSGRARAKLEAVIEPLIARAAGLEGATRAAAERGARALADHAGKEGRAERWRAGLVELALGEAGLAGVRRAIEAEAGLKALDAPNAVAARGALAERIEDGLLHGPTAGERVEIGRAGLAWMTARWPARADRLRPGLAAALLAAGDARGALAELEAHAAANGGRMNAAATLDLARAQAGTGDRAAASATLQGVIAAHDGSADKASSGPRPAVFWEAWAELLELLASEPGAPAERRSELKLRVRQLELLDPNLGGGAVAERIRRAG
jgi:hypothetical protein